MVPLYRQADIIAARTDLHDWWRQHPRPKPDKAAIARRAANAQFRAQARAAAVARLEADLARLQTWDPGELPLVAVSFWLGKLAELEWAYAHSARYANVRARARFYEARRHATQALSDRVWEVIAASGHPLVEVARRSAGVAFTLCASCRDAEQVAFTREDDAFRGWGMIVSSHSQPGCPACAVEPGNLGVLIRFNLASGPNDFVIPLDRPSYRHAPGAQAWTSLGDMTPVRHPFAECALAEGPAQSWAARDGYADLRAPGFGAAKDPAGRGR